MTKKTSMSTIQVRPITNIKILGLTFYYDESEDLIGFPKWYNERTNALDHRVGHQFWIPKSQAKAIIRRILEQQFALEQMRTNEDD